jgi:hypothetical protein
MLEYVDRGLMKWAPFDALQGHHSMISELKYRLGKISKPILSDDQYSEMNLALVESVTNKKLVKVIYYYDGYLYDFISYVIKIDYTFGIVRFKEKTLSYDCIIGLEIA